MKFYSYSYDVLLSRLFSELTEMTLCFDWPAGVKIGGEGASNSFVQVPVVSLPDPRFHFDLQGTKILPSVVV